jgi:hypothetical protein
MVQPSKNARIVSAFPQWVNKIDALQYPRRVGPERRIGIRLIQSMQDAVELVE